MMAEKHKEATLGPPYTIVSDHGEWLIISTGSDHTLMVKTDENHRLVGLKIHSVEITNIRLRSLSISRLAATIQAYYWRQHAVRP